MFQPVTCRSQRRQFLRTLGGMVAGTFGAAVIRADDLPTNVNPHAIHGDRVEPRWTEGTTMTVGPKGADLVGTTGRAIQAAVDAVARLGGGTVRVLPGTYRLRNSVFLRSNVRLIGSGPDTVLFKEPTVAAKLIVDGDHWEQEVALDDPNGFQVGDGVRLVAKDPYGKGTNIIHRTLIARAGNRFKLDQRLEERFYLVGDAKIATNFALLQSLDATDVVIENLAVDGNKTHNELIDGGKYDDGAVRARFCNRLTFRGLTVRNFRCDGIVWGVSHDVRVEDCRLLDGARFAIHPGSGAQRSVLRGNHIHHCVQGVYFCWGAQHGLYEKNVIEDCGEGMTIGHRDSDNLIRDNDIRRSITTGIRFRVDDNKAFAPHRNRIERNRITDIVSGKGIAIDLNGKAEGVAILNNELRETQGPKSRTGIRIAPEIGDLACEGNRIEGFAAAITDLRQK